MVTLRETDFTFSAIEDRDGIDVAVPLRFCRADDKSDKYLLKVWHRLSQAVIFHHELSGDVTKCPTWAKWKPHEWCKQSVPDRQQFVAWHGSVLAGFLNLRKDFASQYGPSKSLVYVEHLASFPGFISSDIWSRKLRYVGVPLLGFAVLQSMLQGCDGSVGLHVDGGAMKFYEQLPDMMGFPVFHPAKYDVSGPLPVGEHARAQAYLEMMPDAANQILEVHRNV